MAGKHGIRDIADYFKPYARQSIPAKRPSPSPDEGNTPNPNATATPRFTKRELKTPVTATRFKDVESSPVRSPIGLGQKASLVIGSPRRPSAHKHSFTSSSSLSTLENTPHVTRTASFDFQSIRSPENPKDVSSANAPASSKKVVRNGKLFAVRDSDEDESDDSLEDLDDLLGRRSLDPPTSSSSSPSVDEDHIHGFGKSKSRSPPHLRDRISAFQKPSTKAVHLEAPKHKFTLDDILNSHLDDQDVEQSVARTRQGYKEQEARQDAKDTGDADRKLLASIAFERNDDAKGATRLMGAVERTEAIGGQRSWSFFKPGRPTVDASLAPAFPESEIKYDSWETVLIEQTERQRAFLSGYVAERWSERIVSVELIRWLLNTILHEPREDLAIAYANTLQLISADSIRKGFTPDLVDDIFVDFGARANAIEPENVVEPQRRVTPGKSADYCTLVTTINCIAKISNHWSTEPLHRFGGFLFRLMLDEHLMIDLRVSTAIEDALCTMIESLSANESSQLCDYLHDSVVKTLTEPMLQKQLLAHILPSSYSLSSLRQRLAETFLLSPDQPSTTSSEPSPTTLTSLIHHLQHSSRYQIPPVSSAHTYDFSLLSCYIYFLDVCILGSLSQDLRVSDPKAFDNQVDDLVGVIKGICSTISDTGASHLCRTEAKEALEALSTRLEFAFRTKVKPRRGIWGGNGEGEKLGLMRFLKTGKKNQESGNAVKGNGEVDGDRSKACVGVGNRKVELGSDGSFSSTEGAIRKQLGL